MRDEYDFSNATMSTYASRLTKQITVRLDEECINYFKSIAEETGVPHQSLITLYLRDCDASNRKFKLEWK